MASTSADEEEETTYNFQFYTFSVMILPLLTNLRGTYSLAGCHFPCLILGPLCGGGGGTSTTSGEGEVPPPPQERIATE